MIDQHHGWNLSTKPLWIGFVISILLIFSLHRIVAYHHLHEHLLAIAIVAIGFFMAVIQLIFFLHLGLEEKPRWNMLMFGFGVATMSIFVGGAIWIMSHLNATAVAYTGG